jgi:hypothetical protein
MRIAKVTLKEKESDDDARLVAAGSALSDRWCIGTNETVILSSEDIAACYKGFNSSGRKRAEVLRVSRCRVNTCQWKPRAIT